MEPKIEKPTSWSLPFLSGKLYQIWWGTGIDFTHLSIATSPSFSTNDLGIRFKFNYSASREVFDIGPMRGGPRQLTNSDFISGLSAPLDSATCSNGVFFHNDTQGGRMLELCQSGKNRSRFEYTEVNAVICRFSCPAAPGTFTR
jgi:hypothetical protein